VLKKPLFAVALLILVLGIAAVVSVRLLLAPERVRAMVEAQASAALGQRVRVASAAARVWPEIGLELRDILIEGTATRLGSVSVATGLRPLFSRRVEDARVTMSDGTIEMPWLLALLASLSDAPQPPPGSRPPLTIVSVRAIELRGITLAAGRHRARIDADGVLQEDQLEVARLDATAEGTSLTASGTFTSISRAVGTFAIEAETLDLDALLALASAATPAQARRTSPAAPSRAGGDTLSIAATVKARSGRLASLAFRDLSTTISVTPSAVRLQPLALRAFDGGFTGRVLVNTGRDVPEIFVAGDATGVDVAALAALAGSPGTISGRLSGRAALACPCADLSQALPTLKGDGRFEIADGAIPGLQIVRTIVLAFGRPEGQAPAGSGERFSKLSAAFTLAGGTLATRDLVFVSRDFDMQGQGTAGVTSGALDFETNVVLSRELSKQAGRDFYRYAREGDRIIVPATISGTIASPRVFIDLSQAVGRALKNELERRGKSLLDRLKGRIRVPRQ